MRRNVCRGVRGSAVMLSAGRGRGRCRYKGEAVGRRGSSGRGRGRGMCVGCGGTSAGVGMSSRQEVLVPGRKKRVMH